MRNLKAPRARLAGVALAFVLLSITALSTGPAQAADVGSIVVDAVGDRDSTSGDPLSLSGATVRAYSDAARTTPVGECVTGADGSCTINGLVPGTYWVAPVDDPVGSGGAFHRITGLATTFGGDVPYVQAIAVTEGNAEARAFAYRRTNPPFPQRCGIRIGLLFDLSGSISAEELATVKDDANEFVDALTATPTEIGVGSFATAAPAAGNASLVLTSVQSAVGANVVKQAIDGLARTNDDDAFTNWDAAFRSVTPGIDIVVMFTDGNPTVHGVPAQFPPVLTDFDQLEAGIVSANAVKAHGTRVLAVGVGDRDDISALNLQAVSGPVESSDYAITTFADVHRVFRALSDALCPQPPPPEVPIITEPELVTVPPPRFTG